MRSGESMPDDLGDEVTLLAVNGGATTAPRQAERDLLVAILEDAIQAYQKYAFSGTRRGRRLFREVHAWFTEPPTIDVPISFDYVCEMLDVSADPIRRALERWRGVAFAGEESARRMGAGEVEGEPAMAVARLGRRLRGRSRHRVGLFGWRVVGGRV